MVQVQNVPSIAATKPLLQIEFNVANDSISTIYGSIGVLVKSYVTVSKFL